MIAHHIPHKVSKPVQERLNSTDELHVFGFIHSLLNEEDHKASWDEGHGKDDADGDQNINWGGHPDKKEKKNMSDGSKREPNTPYVKVQLWANEEEFTHKATWESCSLVRFSGWLKALIANWAGFSLAGRLARRIPLFITLRKAAMLCQPLLLNQICTWRREDGGNSSG